MLQVSLNLENPTSEIKWNAPTEPGSAQGFCLLSPQRPLSVGTSGFRRAQTKPVLHEKSPGITLLMKT